MEKNSTLFTPVRLGAIELKHRVVMAPLTRSRTEQPGEIPGALMLQYYSQRAPDGRSDCGGASRHKRPNRPRMAVAPQPGHFANTWNSAD